MNLTRTLRGTSCEEKFGKTIPQRDSGKTLLRPRRLVEEFEGGKRESCHEEAKFMSL
jgi:hypothetical protein